MRDKYRIIMKNRCNALAKIQSIDDQWGKLQDSIQQTRQEMLIKAKRIGKKKWITEETLHMKDKRRQSKNHRQEYQNING